MSTAFWREFWGNSARRSQPFVGNSGLQHRAEDIQGRDGDLRVAALRSGRVAAHGQQSQVGYWFSLDVGGGRFDIYCHVFVGRRPAVGSIVSGGDEITRMATWGEVTGSAWTGPHIHFVVSDHEAGATRNYNAYDPRPIITAALAAPPPQPAPVSEEDTVAYPFHVDNKHLFLIAPGYIKHFSEIDPATLTKNIVASNDQWIQVTGSQFLQQLNSFGIPQTKVDVPGGRVFDVSVNGMRAGGMWSWAREAQQNTAAILARL